LRVWQDLNLGLLDAWSRCPFKLNGSVDHAHEVVVNNGLIAVGTSKPSKAVRLIFNRVVCIFILGNKNGPGKIESFPPAVVLKLSVGLNIGSATRGEL
jgi:hypothetical protein